MPAKKSTANKINPNNPENPIQVLKEDTCPTSSGKSTLGYQVGIDESGEIFFKLVSNTGGGFFTSQWFAYSRVVAALDAWPEDQPITSMALRSVIGNGKSANNAGFACALIVAAGLLEPVPGKTRVLQACDPTPFLDSVAALQGKAITAGKKPAPRAKSKAAPKAKAKAPAKRTAKTPRTTK